MGGRRTFLHASSSPVNAYEKSGYESQRGTGIGCALLAPVAVIGSILLMEEHAHAGDGYLLAEIVGWWALCISAGLGSTHLLGRWHKVGGRFYAALGAIALPLAVVALYFTVAQPGTPMWVKDAFIASLKVIGFMVVPAIAIWVFWRPHRTG